MENRGASRTCDVAILGAGPYGLAAAAHLAAIRGLDARVFGQPMQFWKAHGPTGALLRSPSDTANISDPRGTLRFADFVKERGGSCSEPISVSRFIEYGHWFQSRAVPFLDRRRVLRVDRVSGGFRLALEDSEVLEAKAVVVAAGLGAFANRPEVFAGLPPERVAHCSEHGDRGSFGGKKVIVVGAGQSAVETAALIREAGGSVELLVRGRIEWYGRGRAVKTLRASALGRLLYASTGVGGAGLGRIIAKPDSFSKLPAFVRNALRDRATRPTATRALLERVKEVRITEGRRVVAARAAEQRLALTLDDGSVREADRVLLATGYTVDVRRYSFLPPELLRDVRLADGFPRLRRGFESSVPGLHFVGAAAAWTFGPLLYSLAGTEFAAATLARHFELRMSS